MAVAAAVCACVLAATESRAEACGCLSPPQPPPGGGEDISINQSAEQIIFEVEEGFVTAHVLIQFAGKPDQFAWIVPVPSVPELGLSPESGFGFLDRQSRPDLSLSGSDACPDSKWECSYAELPVCASASGGGGGGGGCGFSGGSDNAGEGGFGNDAGANGAAQDAGQGGDMPPVEVLDRSVIGSYETIVFSSGDIDGAILWLQDEGFIVNSTMAPFMQPYADAGMLFLASKLVPGANTTDIKPLRMRFATDAPMIPLQLTAVAAEPDMTITAYIYADSPYGPKDFPLAEVNADQLSADSQGRLNYPMLLRRAIDEAGGKNFVAEYRGLPVVVDFDQGTGCCTSGFDICGIQGDGVCSCPGNPLDDADCPNADELLAGAEFINGLAAKHSYLTRLTTRMSAEDMSYDPVFEPKSGLTSSGRLQLANTVTSLSLCDNDIIDQQHYEEILATRDCASVYCGTGSCVITESGAACECGQDMTARRFIDLDGQGSVTCVPDVAPVDLAAGGIELPDVCANVNCGAGSCLDVGGFPTCRCDPGYAGAQAGLEAAPRCEAILAYSNSSGAEDFTKALVTLPVCAPRPPSCGQYGWLTESANFTGTAGFECTYSTPSADEQEEVAPPTCAQRGLREESSGCSTESTSGLTGLGFLGLVLLFSLRRRRRNSAY